MNYKRTTQVPNELFDTHLATLSLSELKLYLIIVRQTLGWQTKNGHRKQRDRITYSQFQNKTGISRRIITQTVQSLITKQMISVMDRSGKFLHKPEDRKGKVGIYYAPFANTSAINGTRVCRPQQKGVHPGVHNKTNTSKPTGSKGGVEKQSDRDRVLEILGF